ncbi:hypothetical protein F7984_01720 [Pradoshia sp. D12]|uniref:Tad domain-containing protein n=1 Tax=Bacillaceae TaxID=186817 RepID=UPI00080ACFD0|nr:MULTISPECIES: Tad domain-containing protein [Bacillaceae]OCA80720.1 hypothetical protein A8L44_16255 [Bacillus sp. FJAT-27986]QFK70070.1 hypothetical protein F7984_01720 [Pradoshia sp. D12]TPF70630.1 hypothetical protein FHY44_16855 [Bacillus sp. D12]
MRKRLNEDGSTTLFILGMLSVMMIMFIVLYNYAKVYAVKEQAFTSSQQASLAATAEFYDRVWNLVAEFDGTDEENLPQPDPDSEDALEVNPITKLKIKEMVERKKTELANSYPEKSTNEVHIMAIDEVLSEELSSGLGKKRLKEILIDNYEHSIKAGTVAKAKEVILANDGKLEKAQIRLFKDNRIYVRAANEFEGQGKLFDGFKEKLFQTGAGPEIGFLSYLDGINDETIQLSNEVDNGVIWGQ